MKTGVAEEEQKPWIKPGTIKQLAYCVQTKQNQSIAWDLCVSYQHIASLLPFVYLSPNLFYRHRSVFSPNGNLLLCVRHKYWYIWQPISGVDGDKEQADQLWRDMRFAVKWRCQRASSTDRMSAQHLSAKERCEREESETENRELPNPLSWKSQWVKETGADALISVLSHNKRLSKRQMHDK